MEKSTDSYIRRLIELDSRAVELKKKRDAELMELEMSIRNELKSLDEMLEETSVKAKQRYEQIIESGRLQAREIDEAAMLQIDKLKVHFDNFNEGALRDIWRQLLEIER